MMAGAVRRNVCILDIWKVETKKFYIEHLLRARHYARFYRAVVPKLLDFAEDKNIYVLYIYIYIHIHTHIYIYNIF